MRHRPFLPVKGCGRYAELVLNHNLLDGVADLTSKVGMAKPGERTGHTGGDRCTIPAVAETKQ